MVASPVLRREAWFDRLWLLAAVLASSVWCLSEARALGPTFDEPFYMQSGLDAWRTGSYAELLRHGAMPLSVDVATLPAYVYERWSGTQLDVVRDLPRILEWARSASLVFWVLLLVYTFAAAQRLAGSWAGRLAVALVAVEPVLLGHAALANADVPVTACLVALTYHFAVGRDQGFWRRVGIPGLWYGAALLAKASTVMLGPVCLVGVEVARALAPAKSAAAPPVPPTVKRFVRDWAAMAAIALGITFVYCGSDWRAEPSFVAWANTLPASRSAEVWRSIATHLRIFPNGGDGLVRQIRHGLLGHGGGAYLLGEVRKSFWYYFPIALSMKVGLPLLALPVLIAATRLRALLNWPNTVAAALLVASLMSRVQIGVRFYLPVIAFAAIGLSASLVEAGRSRGRGTRALLAGAAGAGVIWNLGATAAVGPQALCYTNPLWGGSNQSIVLLSDSNCDWGQGVPDLVAWYRNHGAPPLDVWYFGTDPAMETLPFRQVPLHRLALNTDDDILAAVGGHYLAVSGTLLHGTITNDSQRRAVQYLLRQQPAGRTMTFVIYDFTGRSSVSR